MLVGDGLVLVEDIHTDFQLKSPAKAVIVIRLTTEAVMMMSVVVEEKMKCSEMRETH